MTEATVVCEECYGCLAPTPDADLMGCVGCDGRFCKNCRGPAGHVRPIRKSDRSAATGRACRMQLWDPLTEQQRELKAQGTQLKYGLSFRREDGEDALVLPANTRG